jgi:hypothetical protein
VSPDAQAIVLFIAFACFVASAILHAIPRAWPTALIAIGLAAWVLVPLWTVAG